MVEQDTLIDSLQKLNETEVAERYISEADQFQEHLLGDDPNKLDCIDAWFETEGIFYQRLAELNPDSWQRSVLEHNAFAETVAQGNRMALAEYFVHRAMVSSGEIRRVFASSLIWIAHGPLLVTEGENGMLTIPSDYEERLQAIFTQLEEQPTAAAQILREVVSVNQTLPRKRDDGSGDQPATEREANAGGEEDEQSQTQELSPEHTEALSRLRASLKVLSNRDEWTAAQLATEELDEEEGLLALSFGFFRTASEQVEGMDDLAEFEAGMEDLWEAGIKDIVVPGILTQFLRFQLQYGLEDWRTQTVGQHFWHWVRNGGIHTTATESDQSIVGNEASQNQTLSSSESDALIDEGESGDDAGDDFEIDPELLAQMEAHQARLEKEHPWETQISRVANLLAHQPQDSDVYRDALSTWDALWTEVGIGVTE